MDVFVFASDVKMCSGPDADHSFLGLQVGWADPAFHSSLGLEVRMDVFIFASDVKMCSGPDADHSFLGLEVRMGRPGVSFFPRSGGKDGCIYFLRQM